MRALMLEVPESLLAERQRLGTDRWDEMWEGVLHMVPPPSSSHQRLGSRLLQCLLEAAARCGLEGAYESGLFAPLRSDSFRVPDLVVARPDRWSRRGVEGAASLVVELLSPGDESFDKLPFYEQLGVAEVLFLDALTRELRLWRHDGARLVEQQADGAGWLSVAGLGLRIRLVPGPLTEVEGEGIERRSF